MVFFYFNISDLKNTLKFSENVILKKEQEVENNLL